MPIREKRLLGWFNPTSSISISSKVITNAAAITLKKEIQGGICENDAGD